MMQGLKASLWWLWDGLLTFANSNFSTSLMGALLGAAMGAYAASKIAERRKRIDDIVAEIRNANAAIILAHMICNTFIELKRQHVVELLENYNRQQIAHAEHVRVGDQGPFHLDTHFVTVPVPLAGTSALENIAYNRLSLRNRALMLVPHLVEVVEKVRGALSDRIRIIAEFKEQHVRGAALAHAYLGLPNHDNETDARYRGIVHSIGVYTDDAIYFSKMLSEDISAHADAVRATLSAKEAKNAPTVYRVLYHAEPGIIPEPAGYESWNEQPR